MKLKSDNAVRNHFQRSGLTAICMVSNPDIYRVFADTSLSLNYPENLHHLTLFTVSLLRMVTRLHSLADNFSVSCLSSVQHFAVLSAFRFSRSNFLLSDRLILSALSLSTILILLLIMNLCNSFTFDCFTPGSITKK
jgi:hypothetical protein